MSIDTEQFCHEMAQRLCTQAQKKYWFCSDFNVEIIDLCLETNDVVAAGKCVLCPVYMSTLILWNCIGRISIIVSLFYFQLICL